MAKNREERLHPITGKLPGRGAQADPIVDDAHLDNQMVIEERYGIDPDTNHIDGVQVRHPNRDKRTDRRSTDSGKSSSGTGSGTGGKATTSFAVSKLDADKISHVSRELLEELFNFQGNFCISIYQSLHQSGTDGNSRVGLIALKNALQQAQRSADGVDKALVERTLSPIFEWLRNDESLNNVPGNGIALFISEGYFRYAILPDEPANRILVNNSFLIAPLLPAFIKEEHFYLLVISKKQSKLFRGDQYGLTFIPVPEMPNGIEDVVHLEEKDDENLFRSGSSGGGGGAVYHGTGSTRPDDKDNIAFYLAEVDSTIRKQVLHDSTAPLLLAGVGYLIPIYKKVSHYNHVWDKAIIGSYEYENEVSLFTAARELMSEYFEATKKKALADYGNKSATNLTSHILDDIIRAAYYKRIDTLFVEKRARLWGTFDEVNDKLEVHASEGSDKDDLIDKTILKTILSGGSVFMLDENEMPMRRMMLAVMRF